MLAVALISLFVVPMSELLASMRFDQKVEPEKYYWMDKFLKAKIGGKDGGTFPGGRLSYEFHLTDVVGKKSCRRFNWRNKTMHEVTLNGTQTLAKKIGTSSLPTAVGILDDNIVLTTNSSSITLDDIFVFKPDAVSGDTLTDISSLNIGPGIADMSIAGRTAYVANTSVQSQAIAIDLHDPSRPTIKRTFTFPGSNSATSPISKRVIVYGSNIIIGTEKSTLPEIEIFNIDTGALLSTINTEFGINRLFAAGNKLIVLGPTDPELNVYDMTPLLLPSLPLPQTLTKSAYYDAPGGSGNGRSADIAGDRIIFGRSKGGNELEVMKSVTEVQEEINTYKLSASVDNVITDTDQTLVFTSDSSRELQVFENEKDASGNVTALNKVAEFNLPARTADAVCVGDKLYVALQSPVTPLVIIR